MLHSGGCYGWLFSHWLSKRHLSSQTNEHVGRSAVMHSKPLHVSICYRLWLSSDMLWGFDTALELHDAFTPWCFLYYKKRRDTSRRENQKPAGHV